MKIKIPFGRCADDGESRGRQGDKMGSPPGRSLFVPPARFAQLSRSESRNSDSFPSLFHVKLFRGQQDLSGTSMKVKMPFDRCADDGESRGRQWGILLLPENRILENPRKAGKILQRRICHVYSFHRTGNRRPTSGAGARAVRGRRPRAKSERKQRVFGKNNARLGRHAEI